jgi:hypothetical protein
MKNLTEQTYGRMLGGIAKKSPTDFYKSFILSVLSYDEKYADLRLGYWNKKEIF